MNAAFMDIQPARLFNVRIALVIACMLGVFTLLAASVAEARGGRGGGGGMRGGGGGRMGYSSVGSANRASTRPSSGNSSGNRGNAGDRAGTQPATRPGNVGSGDRAGNGKVGSGDRINNDLPGSGDRLGNINNGNINIDVDPGYGQIRYPLAAGLVVGAAIGAAAGAYYPYYGYGYGYGYWGGYYGDCSYYGGCHYSIPADCPKIDTYAVPYYFCDGTYYQQQMQGDTVVYVVVDPSAVGKDAKVE